MATRDSQGRRMIYMMPNYDLLAEVGKRVIVRLSGGTPGVLAQFDLESPEELDRFIAELMQLRSIAWAGEDDLSERSIFSGMDF